MNLSRTSCALLIGLAGFVCGCAETSIALQKAEAQPEQKADAQNQRKILNEGYSIFYSTVDDLSKFDLIFLVKSETKPVHEVTTAVTEYADTLKTTLDRVAKDYPAVNMELDPLPVIEQRTRGGITKDRLLSFAPVVGLTGESFDRRMLQTLEGTLNQLRFMAKALADEEPEPSLKQIATTAHNRFEQLYDRVLNCSTRSTSSTPGSGKSRRWHHDAAVPVHNLATVPILRRVNRPGESRGLVV